MNTPRIVVVGGDAALEGELVRAAEEAGTIVVLPRAAAALADVVIVAGGPLSSALDLARAERAQSPTRPVLVADDTLAPADAMACGARGIVARPLTAVALLRALASADVFRPSEQPAGHGAHRAPIVLLGAAGGAGTTSCAVALADAEPWRIVVDLALATGDAAAVAGAVVSAPDAMLSLTSAPTVVRSEIESHLAVARRCRVLPAPSLPEHADLIDVEGIERVLAACARAELQPIIDAGTRVGVETIPALERAARVLLVGAPDARGLQGARRLALLLGRLGLADHPIGFVAQRAGGTAAARTVAGGIGVPLLACVRHDRRVSRARERSQPVPQAPFRRLVAAVGP